MRFIFVFDKAIPVFNLFTEPMKDGLSTAFDVDVTDVEVIGHEQVFADFRMRNCPKPWLGGLSCRRKEPRWGDAFPYDEIAIMVDFPQFSPDRTTDQSGNPSDGRGVFVSVLELARKIIRDFRPSYGCQLVESHERSPPIEEALGDKVPRVYRGNYWNAGVVERVGRSRIESVARLHIERPDEFPVPWAVQFLETGGVLFYEQSTPMYPKYETPNWKVGYLLDATPFEYHEAAIAADRLKKEADGKR